MKQIVLIMLGLLMGFAQESRHFPVTRDGIFVFSDQIDVHNLTEPQAQFAAVHYVGAQKLTRSGARLLRRTNPNFITLHYRLGLGIGYQTPDSACQPGGNHLEIIEGDEWRQEWPGDIPENWLYHINGQRVYHCEWGWYLADIDEPSWRDWWLGEVERQLAATESDGLFADSVSVPNYLGSDAWNPVLPAYDKAFESDWTHRINDWLTWLDGAFQNRYTLIVNAGMLVTARETTDYSRADGVMVEGFAGWGEYDRFEIGDWNLQINHILPLINQDRIVILQSYVQNTPERLWTLANYLLIKGDYTYINIETGQNVEWFPEYDLPIGTPLSDPPETVEDLRDETGLYTRAYSGGWVLVNPAGEPVEVSLDQPMSEITGTVGGGDIPDDADISGWQVLTTTTTSIRVDPGQAVILLYPAAEAVSTPAPVNRENELTAFHRSGQTFLTWPELSANPQMTYRIYQHTTPIESLAEATLLAEVPQGSGIYWTERARATDPQYDTYSDYRALNNYVITDLGPELPDGTGLFVWTTQRDGDSYYAVQSADGQLFATTGPVTEQIAAPQPVLVWQSNSGLSRVYTQFMDYAAYNPTFDAPRPGNSYMGLPNWADLENAAGQQQYAYNYWVGLPSADACGGTVPDTIPLILHLEGWGSRYYTPDSAPYWCAAMIWGDDPSQSWYFGFSAVHDYRTDLPVTAGPIVNYTEVRLLDAVHHVMDTQRAPGIDANRIYVYGHSMGGTGALALAERYPQIFAAAAASEPMMDFAAASLWIEELESKWGTRASNLPVELRGPDAAYLTPVGGVWDWQNLGEQLSARRGDEMAFIAIAHGTQDTVIDWDTVARPAYAHFYTGQRGFIGEIMEADHTWLGFRTYPNWNFDWMNFYRDESFPALSHASGDSPIPPEGVGGYNLTLEWSSKGNNFAGPPIDTANEWALVLRSLDGEQTVDITPRRLQHFTVTPGSTYQWQNIRLSDNTLLQEGTVIADSAGLIQVVGFQVDEDGNRLIIRPF